MHNVNITHLSIDYGTKKCGFAIGDDSSRLVLAKEIIATLYAIERIEYYLSHYPTLHTCIVSQNNNFHHQVTRGSQLQKEFAHHIQHLYGTLNVVLYDERGTTAAFGKNNDDLSAQHLLQQYFRFH